MLCSQVEVLCRVPVPAPPASFVQPAPQALGFVVIMFVLSFVLSWLQGRILGFPTSRAASQKPQGDSVGMGWEQQAVLAALPLAGLLLNGHTALV